MQLLLMCTMCKEAPEIGGGADDFADGLDAGARLEQAEAADMREHRHVPRCRQPKHLDHFEAGRARRVLNAHADAQRAGIEFLPQAIFDRLDLLRAWRVGWSQDPTAE